MKASNKFERYVGFDGDGDFVSYPSEMTCTIGLAMYLNIDIGSTIIVPASYKYNDQRFFF